MTALGSGHVLDASALLAYLHSEPGSAYVRPRLRPSHISSLNWSEVLQKTLARGANITGMRDEITAMGVEIRSFGAIEAEHTAELWIVARNLSLADRSCLALARLLGLPVLTADRIWATLNLGVEVRLIR